ncbi:MAG: nucleotidyltransferase [Calditrichaeota bacterium]|nr:MAG: nucleotidyltransferase [Calditrichota bacterium]MBL1203857.1 nucleotidyltransferase [Calditrichota bacterium]NOG43689.1 nucleotidyltransferase [Calditrichota bacterium]
MGDKDIRWEQRFSNYQKAVNKISEVVEKLKLEELTELEVEGLIQRFEYTYELAWKTLQDLFKHQEYIGITGPGPVLDQAFKDGLIEDAEGWRRLKKSRELTSHTYDSRTAEAIAEEVVENYYLLFKRLEDNLIKLKSK